MAKRILIDDIAHVDPALITHENLTVLHETGQSVYVSGTGKDKVFRYRVGKQTEIGDIEQSVWKGLVKQLIEKSGEEELLNQYREWVRANVPWIWNVKTAEMGALELYVSQTHLKRSWWGYVSFNMAYDPDRLNDDPTLLRVLPDCCKKELRVPPEGIRQNHLEQQVISCPHCKDSSTFTYL